MCVAMVGSSDKISRVGQCGYSAGTARCASGHSRLESCVIYKPLPLCQKTYAHKSVSLWHRGRVSCLRAFQCLPGRREMHHEGSVGADVGGGAMQK